MPVCGSAGIITPARAPSRWPCSQVLPPIRSPASYSSVYSPMCQTLPSLSWARKASSASTSSPSLMSRSYTTTELTPPIILVRSVTVMMIWCSISSPSSTVMPSYVYRVPAGWGHHWLSMTVGLSKFVGLKS